MFSKIKQFVGMVGVKVELEVPKELPFTASTVDGVIRINATQNQTITTVKVNMKQVHREGSGSETSTREFEIGEVIVTSTPFEIKAGETKEFPFTLPFTRKKTQDQRMAEQGGVVGALGKFGKMMDNEQENFWVNAMADVKGAALDPNATQEVKFKK